MPGRMELRELPGREDPDYFRLLVRNCIETYKELPNDAACLDFNKVSGKLRALVLDDEEYKQETRNISAERSLAELRELEDIARLTPSGGEDDDTDPRAAGGKKKSVNADKDALAVRFKAAQMRREIIASMNEDNNASERDAVNLMFVGMSRGEIEKSARSDIYEGGSDGALDELAAPKEEAPEGSSGKIRRTGGAEPPAGGDFFDLLPDGSIVEK